MDSARQVKKKDNRLGKKNFCGGSPTKSGKKQEKGLVHTK